MTFNTIDFPHATKRTFYALRDRANGLYRDRWGRPVKLEEARLFNRKCDAGNALSWSLKNKFEIVTIEAEMSRVEKVVTTVYHKD